MAEKDGGLFCLSRTCHEPNNRKQAYVPEGAVIFNNDVGTAPGMAIETNGGKVLILLPGPPEETKFVLENEMMPYLRQKFQSQGSSIPAFFI